MINDIKSHYNKRPATTRRLGQKNVPHGPVRCYNNFVKASLLRRYLHVGDTLLDIACGSGGDLAKVQRCVSRYVGIDVAPGCIERAVGRARSRHFEAAFFVIDARREFGLPALRSSAAFDVCSCQLGPQFFCESEATLRVFVANVARVLRVGGVFLASMPDSAELERRSADCLTREGRCEFGNAAYKVEYEAESGGGLAAWRRYDFSLPGCIEKCPEYVAPWREVRGVFEEAGFRLLERPPFLSYSRRDHDLQRQMHASGSMLPDAREICGLYVTFAFKFDPK